MDEDEILLEIIRDLFGKEKHYYASKGQISINCPYCDDGKNKGNLEININEHVYKCWSCGQENGTHGVLGKLIDIFGTKNQKKTYDIFKPEEHKSKHVELKKLKLPKEFISIKDANPLHIPHREVLKYIKSRGITDEMIEKFNIGFATDGDYGGRIIIPSYGMDDEINYFISRAWFNTKNKYKNPEYPKETIIFNEKLIDWNKPIYLCEGAIDGFFTPNPVVLLGKILHDLLFETIYTKAKSDVIICLDADAWKDAQKLYNQLNGGKLRGRVKILKLPKDSDIADLKGKIDDYFYEMSY
ncbi:DNA primase [uncultured Caudovirales phage]|uniref:DNA primase n=1 Tax=uncultured Caudovirales phage TaxID=2100421 RepID=A0A6J5L5R7_9CAUD|nr:DNA primase [uncultured Caudovirales phage]